MMRLPLMRVPVVGPSLLGFIVALSFALLTPTCSGSSAREICGNSVDDDSNGLIDCADPDCAGQDMCPAIYRGPCMKCGHACALQGDCITGSYAAERPIPMCTAGLCEALNKPIAIRVEYDTKDSWGSLLSPKSVVTRFIKKTAADGSAVTCAVVEAAAPGCKAAQALQIEESRKFLIQGFDLFPLQSPMLGSGVNLPLVNVGTGADYLIYTEFWGGERSTDSSRPTGNRLGFGCFDTADNTAIVANDACPSADNDGGICRTFRLKMPGPMTTLCQ